MHNLELTEDQTMILDTVRKFVADAVLPVALEHDEHRQFAGAELGGLAELGLFGLPVAETAGGAGMGFVPLVAALEEIGTVSGSLARLWIGQLQCALALEVAAAPPLEEIVAGERLAVFLGPEHGISAANGQLSGKAELVPGAGEAAVFVVAATQDGQPALFVVDAQGSKRTAQRSLGLCSTAPCRVEFAGSMGAAVATGGTAAQAIARAQLVAWIGGAAVCVGMGAASVTASRRHASERIAFGKPLLVQQAVVRKLVDGRRGIDAARHLVWHAARLLEQGADATPTALQAKVAAAEAAVHAADEAIQIHGGFGYTVEYHVERHYRDAKMFELLDGGADRARDWLGRQFA